MVRRKFVAKDGQIDYTNIRYCPVVNCIAQHKDKILLLHRSVKLHFYPGYWSGVSGFLDDDKSIEDKVREEFQEELGVDGARILQIAHGSILRQEAPKYSKTWLVVPVLVTLKSKEPIKLDWESKELKWVTPSQARRLNLTPGFDAVLDNFFPREHKHG